MIQARTMTGVAVVAALAVVALALRARRPEPAVAVSGRVEADEAVLAARAGGRLLRVLVREGDTVAAGQVLAEVDATQLAARESGARAAVAVAEARLQQARHRLAAARS